MWFIRHVAPRRTFLRPSWSATFACLFAAVFLFGAASLRAATYSWGAMSGNWFAATNWSSATVPSSSDTVVIDNGGTALVTSATANCWLLSLGSGLGSGTVQLNGGTFAAFNEDVGDYGPGTFLHSGGVNNLSSLSLGTYAGGSGTYNLSGANARLHASGYEFIGFASSGSFVQSNGTNNVDGWLYVGYSAGSRGTYNLNGGLLKPVIDERIGWGGTGVFTQSGGTNAGNVLLGYDPGSSGDYYLTGGLLSGSWVVFNGGTASFTQSGGTNNSGCSFEGGNRWGVGNFAYNLNGGLLVLSSITIGYGYTAAFNFSGGTLRAGGLFSSSVPMTLGTSGGGATFDTGGNTLALSGPLSGPGSLTKLGGGTLTLATSNTYSGTTLVAAGMLTLQNAAALQNSTWDTRGAGILNFGALTAGTLGGLTGSGTVRLLNSLNSPLALSVGGNGDNTTYSGRLTGSGNLIKIGSGTLTLTGALNNNSGATIVNQGKLLVDGSLLNSTVTVQSGGTLGGTGYLWKATVNAGGHLAPGDGPGGVLSLAGDLSLLSGALMDYRLDTPSTSDKVSLPARQLFLADQQFTDFSFMPLAGFAPGQYTLINAGGISGALGANTSGTVNGYSAAIAIQDNNLVLNVVPEPSTLGLLVVAALVASPWREKACKNRKGVRNRFY